MSTVQWKPGLAIAQDPDAVRDYAIDFAEFLEGETLASVVVTPTACTATKQSSDDASVKVRVSAVTAGASVTIHITTSSGQVDDRTINFTPAQL